MILGVIGGENSLAFSKSQWLQQVCGVPIWLNYTRSSMSGAPMTCCVLNSENYGDEVRV
jgi:hypothetical protein